MIRRAPLTAHIQILDRGELKEFQAAANERVEKLVKFEKNLSSSELGTAASDVRATLRIWQGVDGESGLLERIADQMSLYEPAFSDNGREPDGQTDLLDGIEPTARVQRVEPVKEEKDPAVDYPALKAALILSGASARADDSAFDKLDADVPEEHRSVFVGRAPLELLHELPAFDAAVLYEIALDHVFGAAVDEGLQEEDQEAFRKLATATAQRAETIAPYFEPFPIGEDANADPADYRKEVDEGRAHTFHEMDFAELTRGELERIIQRAEAERTAGLLSLVVSERASHGINVDDILTLSFDELGKVMTYAARVHLAASDNDLDVPEKPEVLETLEAKWEDLELPPYQPTAAEKVQEDVLTNKPVSDPFFKDTLKQATAWACRRALEITGGLDGHATRTKLLEKRLQELEPAAAEEAEEEAPAAEPEKEEPVSDTFPVKTVEPHTEDEKAAALAKVESWGQYRGYCFRYGVKLIQADFDRLMEERANAEEVPATVSGSSIPDDDDLL